MRDFFWGLVLMIAGLLLFFNNVTVTGFSLFRYHSIPLGGIMIIVLGISIILFVAKRNMITSAFAAASLVALVITVILSIELDVRRMPALFFIGIIAAICVGLGLMLKDVWKHNKKK